MELHLVVLRSIGLASWHRLLFLDGIWGCLVGLSIKESGSMGIPNAFQLTSFLCQIPATVVKHHINRS
jgi:hypothetical protein